MQLELWTEPAQGAVSAQCPVPWVLRPGALGTRHWALAADLLLHRLTRLGLPPFPRFETHRNRHVMISWTPGKRFRVHEGYAQAPDEVLAAIVRFVLPGTGRAVRLAAREIFIGFPAEEHAPAPPGAAREPRARPEDAPALARLSRMHAELNRFHFEGGLGEIQLLVSHRMRRRLGEVRLDRKTGRAVLIAISRRHIRRDGWAGVTATLLHEMIHQWQAETGRPVDHGAEFRRKARQVGIEPRAVRGIG